MIAVLMLLAATSSAADLAKAQKLYEKAQYDRALNALDDTCDAGSEFVLCERLKAFILLALGRDNDARAAFHRMLAQNPDASLGPDVSPKLTTLFNNAKREVVDLQDLELEAVDTKAEPGSFVLKVEAPEEIEVKNIKAYVAGVDNPTFVEVALSKEGDAWIGTIKAAFGEKLKYYLVAILPTDVPIMAGSEEEPLTRTLPVKPVLGGARDGDGAGKKGGSSAFDGAGIGAPGSVASSASLPSWAIWTIVGGAVAVVAVGVTLAVVLTRESKPGTILVNVKFEDEL